MPTTIEAFIVLIFGIAPGFAGIRGYSRRRYKTVPDRDLYALAGAAVVSAIWLGLVWLALLLFGNPVKDWGIIPFDGGTVEQYRLVAVGCLGLGVICIPYPLGLAAAFTMDRTEALAGSEGRAAAFSWRLIRKTGLFKPPTAWDRAWLHLTRSHGANELLVQMDDGLLVRGGFGPRSQADLSPNPPRLFLESGYGYRLDDDGEMVEVEGVGGVGVCLPGEKINAIYFGPAADAREGASKVDAGVMPKDTGDDR